ncbi:MAG: hypothetical protein GC204_04450 [Chloroflexi bacterium]|nr:hypothetical protein [Chloroflexota bacterium]
MSGDHIKIALIGAGGWGIQHARIFAARPDVDFCAIAGRTEARTRQSAQQFGTHCYLNIQEMLDKEQPDHYLRGQGEYRVAPQKGAAYVPRPERLC